MGCATNTYTVDGISCLTLPSGIKDYSMISNQSETAAIVIVFIVMLVILFCALFLFRKNNIDEKDLGIEKLECDVTSDKNPIHRIVNAEKPESDVT